MTFQIIFFSFVVLLLIIAFLFYEASMLLEKNNLLNDDVDGGKSTIKSTYIIIIALVSVSFLVYVGYPIVTEAGLNAHLMEWLHLVVRWAHVVLGIAWIGASFYFIFLENSLNRKKNLRDEIAGNLWAIHGGGFYYIEKYKSAPGVIPEKLHWFKYEAYFTWLTGMILLVLVYYMNAKSFMVDPAVNSISTGTAVGIGIISLFAGWFIYDLLCRSPLLSRPKVFGIISFFILVIISYVLSKFLSGRAAFIHVGALLGTIMAGNVFFVIIPAQKELVNASLKNLPLNPEKSKYAGLRSLHNNYITLPVIFVMISNHFPGTFASTYNWLILAILTIGSISVRHYINLYEKEIYSSWFLVLGTISLFALVFITSPKKSSLPEIAPVKFSEVQTIIAKRCISCHSTNPTDDIQKVPPNGLKLETPEEIVKVSDRIMFRVVQTKTMPQGNKTGITDAERTLLGAWIDQGSKTSQ
jgi:uncharacterized membrane protein